MTILINFQILIIQFDIIIMNNLEASWQENQNGQFKARSMSPNDFILWLVFLAEKIQPDSDFLLTKVLNRQLGNVRQFKRSKKYQRLKNNQFAKMYKDYLNGTLNTATSSNPAQRLLIGYLISQEKYNKKGNLEQLKNSLDKIRLKEGNSQSVFYGSDNSLDNNKRQGSTPIINKKQTNEANVKGLESHFNIKKRGRPQMIISKVEEHFDKSSKSDCQLHTNVHENVNEKQWCLVDFLRYSIDNCLRTYPILRKVQSNHLRSPYDKQKAQQIYEIVKEISNSQHQLDYLVTELQKCLPESP